MLKEIWTNFKARWLKLSDHRKALALVGAFLIWVGLVVLTKGFLLLVTLGVFVLALVYFLARLLVSDF